MEAEIRKVQPLFFDVGMNYASMEEERTFLLMADVHFDNPKCNRKLFFSHLEEAKNRDAGVLIFGDLLCLMQGKYDPRRSKKDVRPEHNVANYLDAVISDTAEKLSPYAENFLLFSDGNHETGIIKNVETDPLERLCERLRANYGSPVVHGGYQGFLRFSFRRKKEKVRSTLSFFHHGKYGGAVTKGVLGVNRHGLNVPQAEVIITGHTHDRWLVSQPRLWLKKNGSVDVQEQWHVKCGTYKEEIAQPGGWAVQKIVQAKSSGSWWMTLSPKRTGGVYIKFEPTT